MGALYMLQLTPQARVFLACAPADFRRGIDVLAALSRQRLGADPMVGAVFVFRNRRSRSLKFKDVALRCQALVFFAQPFQLIKEMFFLNPARFLLVRAVILAIQVCNVFVLTPSSSAVLDTG